MSPDLSRPTVTRFHRARRACQRRAQPASAARLAPRRRRASLRSPPIPPASRPHTAMPASVVPAPHPPVSRLRPVAPARPIPSAPLPAVLLSPQRHHPPRRPIKPRTPFLALRRTWAHLARIAPYAFPFRRMRAISPFAGDIFAPCMLFGVKMATSSPHVSISRCNRVVLDAWRGNLAIKGSFSRRGA